MPGRGRIAGGGASASDCPECEWSLVPACRSNTGPGGGKPRDLLCVNATETCQEPGEVRYGIYFRRDSTQEWQDSGQTCLGANERPVTQAQIAAALREPFEKLVPQQRAGFQPANGALVHLPAIFFGGQPTTTRGTVSVLGLQVRITATPTWTWTFEPGATFTTTTPGASYPAKDVTHTYQTTGKRTVELVTTWRGKYELTGEGPYPIVEPVVQTATLPLQVYEARS
ncbi:MAG: hypothetical protein M3P96_07365 [Actinomycetota bacterium]|nr:hypothetical protein [Actinomycetota bacterium]